MKGNDNIYAFTKNRKSCKLLQIVPVQILIVEITEIFYSI